MSNTIYFNYFDKTNCLILLAVIYITSYLYAISIWSKKQII